MSTRLTMPIVYILATLFALCVPVNNAKAEEQLAPHFAFSTYFGSGIYSSSGNDVTVFNIPLVFDPDWDDIDYLEDVHLRIPISVGLANFAYDEIEETRPLEDASTITVALGLEKDYWDSKKLKLVPFFDIGYSEDLSTHNRAMTFAVGTSIFRYTRFWGEQQLIYGKIQHAGFSRKESRSQNFSSLQIGSDFKFPERFGSGRLSTFMTMYLTSYFYMVGIEFEETNITPLQDEWVHEAGFTWGLDDPIETSVANVERIGLGYRFSEKSPGAVHITFNFPLD
ncbi:hypothetical protein A3750_09775 [Oleiphilus sp. HI0079]|nr:hypothetical protein A3737_11020 [Oleiphilus sp. HI0065]KZZ04894.1 hypothetical protein A3744_09495 [Oleiphilus sp. HI0073]KZZ15411.1 hypothetical protein A3751_03405 [Oleiphilus sp. HI0080]KZZ17047.1 hypothetical protein A3750_09775 [Oleiphilus sp. HI0079]KZZ50149.1 hypothetical protein A3760_20575 [Oleiphilus sp. HI0122]